MARRRLLKSHKVPASIVLSAPETITSGASNVVVTAITNNVTVTDYAVTSPASISAKSSGQTGVTISVPGNTGASRTFTVLASGNSRNALITASTQFVQGGVTPVLTVSAVGSSVVAYSATSVSFKVHYGNISETIVLSSNIGTLSTTGITPSTGSATETVTVTMGANTNPETRNITLTATTTAGGETITDNDTVRQNGAQSRLYIETAHTVSFGVSSTTLTVKAHYLSSSTIQLSLAGGAYFDTAHTLTSDTVNIASAVGGTGSTTVEFYFDRNMNSGESSNNSITYTMSASGTGNTGRTITGSCTVTHNPFGMAKLYFDPDTYPDYGTGKTYTVAGSTTSARMFRICYTADALEGVSGFARLTTDGTKVWTDSDKTKNTVEFVPVKPGGQLGPVFTGSTGNASVYFNPNTGSSSIYYYIYLSSYDNLLRDQLTIIHNPQGINPSSNGTPTDSE